MYTEKAKRLVLGEGETIGHKHVVQSGTGLSYDRADQSIRMMLSDVGILTHDEHDRMVFTPGKYRSYNQVELNPMTNSVDRVYD